MLIRSLSFSLKTLFGGTLLIRIPNPSTSFLIHVRRDDDKTVDVPSCSELVGQDSSLVGLCQGLLRPRQI